MVEVAMPAFGPGITTGGGCDFRCSLSSGVMNRMGTEQAIKVQAADLATAKSELAEGNPFDIYRLFVGEATYRDKISGTIVTEKTLLSSDSNSESIGVWTAAGEHGTGSKEEYQAILSRAREFAKTEGAASMFWVSPAKEERVDGLPEHRAYLWKKNDKGEVTAYSYQFTGSQNTLVKTLSNLSTDASFVDTQTLLWKSPGDNLTHQKVFDAYTSSLTLQEAERAQGFLTRFKKEVDQPDSVRWERIESYKKQYEQKLREAYKGDIQSAVESVASGFLALARENISSYTQSNFSQEAIENPQEPKRIPEKEDLMVHAYREAHQKEENKIAFIEKITTSVVESRDDKNEVLEEKKTGGNEDIEMDVVRIIEPTVPILLTAIALFLENTSGEIKQDESVFQQKTVLMPIDATTLISNNISLRPSVSLLDENHKGKNGTDNFEDINTLHSGDISSDAILDEELAGEIWQNFFALLFSPNEQDGIEVENTLKPDPPALCHPEASAEGSLSLSQEISRIRERFFATLRMTAEPKTAGGSVFEHLALLLSDTEESGERIPQEIETEIVDMAKDILTLLLSEKNPLENEQEEKRSTSNESEMYLSLFLSLYAEKETSPEMKELFALFLYEEMKTLGKEHTSSLSQNVRYLTFVKEMALYEPLFEEKKALVSGKLWQLLSAEIENNHYINLKSKRKIETLLFLLYALHKNEPEKISSLIVVVEQLKRSVSGEGREDTMDGYLFQLERLLVSRQKKPSYAGSFAEATAPKKASEGKAGIIYWFWQNEYYRFVGLSLLVVNQI